MDRGVGPSEQIADISGTWTFEWLWNVVSLFALFGVIAVAGQVAGALNGESIDASYDGYIFLAWFALLAKTAFGTSDERHLKSRGLRASATVSEVTHKEHGDGNPGWLVRYGYHAADGTDRVGSRYFATADIGFRPGDEIPIVFDPRRPSLSGWLEPRSDAIRLPSLGSAAWWAIAFLVAVGILLTAVVVRVFDDASMFGTAGIVLFVAFGVLIVPVSLALNSRSELETMRPGTRFAARVLPGLEAEIFIAFGILATSPLNRS